MHGAGIGDIKSACLRAFFFFFFKYNVPLEHGFKAVGLGVVRSIQSIYVWGCFDSHTAPLPPFTPNVPTTQNVNLSDLSDAADDEGKKPGVNISGVTWPFNAPKEELPFVTWRDIKLAIIGFVAIGDSGEKLWTQYWHMSSF